MVDFSHVSVSVLLLCNVASVDQWLIFLMVPCLSSSFLQMYSDARTASMDERAALFSHTRSRGVEEHQADLSTDLFVGMSYCTSRPARKRGRTVHIT
jgi:hypothetical protein